MVVRDPMFSGISKVTWVEDVSTRPNDCQVNSNMRLFFPGFMYNVYHPVVCTALCFCARASVTCMVCTFVSSYMYEV